MPRAQSRPQGGGLAPSQRGPHRCLDAGPGRPPRRCAHCGLRGGGARLLPQWVRVACAGEQGEGTHPASCQRHSCSSAQRARLHHQAPVGRRAGTEGRWRVHPGGHEHLGKQPEGPGTETVRGGFRVCGWHGGRRSLGKGTSRAAGCQPGRLPVSQGRGRTRPGSAGRTEGLWERSPSAPVSHGSFSWLSSL